MTKTILALLALASPAMAQGSYTIQRPGQPPAFVYQQGNNATVLQQGAPPAFVYTQPNGGATILQQGQPPTFISPPCCAAPRPYGYR